MQIKTTLASWGLLASFVSVFAFFFVTIWVPALSQRQGMALMLGIMLLCCIPALELILRDFGTIEMPILVASMVFVGIVIGAGWITYSWLSDLAGQSEVIYRSPVTAFYATISMVGLWISTALSLHYLGLPKGPIIGSFWVGTPAFFATTLLLGLRFLV